ncbi:hypothetical protein EUTSA_v10028215mg, partial [Eutrema salsugineum]
MAPKKGKKTANPRLVSSKEDEEEEESHSFKPSHTDAKDTHVEKSESEEDIVDVEEEHEQEPKPEISHPKSSTAKRSLEKADHDEVRKKKRSKTEKTEDKKQPSFERVFSEEDSVALLQGFLDFNSTSGDPFKDKDRFYGFVKDRISANASRNQVTDKVRKLKDRFLKTVKNSIENGKGGEDTIVYPKDVDQRSFDLWRKIWGREGVFAHKSLTNLQGNIKKEAEKAEMNVVRSSPPLDFGREIVFFLKEENITKFALDESSVLERWNMSADEQKKRALEEKLKKITEMQLELCVDKFSIVSKAAELIFKANNASSS